MIAVAEALQPQNVLLDLSADGLAACLSRFAAHLQETGQVTESQAEALTEALLAREQMGATTIGHGVTVPHAYPEPLADRVSGFIRLARPAPYDTPDDEPVDLVFVLAGPADAQAMHLPVLAHLVRLLHHDWLRAALREAATPDEVVQIFAEAERRHG